jgi:hypothetical protein
VKETPDKWLRELGAVRPRAVASDIASDVVLVIGEWKQGCYPIRYWRGRVCLGAITETEDWHLFGVRCAAPLTRENVRRIVDHLS